jgi:inward rectifier potassium channel
MSRGDPGSEPLLGREPPGHGRRVASRIVPRDDDDGIVAIGLRRAWRRDVYYRALTLPWPSFVLILSAIYIAANVGFALLYLGDRGDIANARPGAFSDALFFSVQTMATVGYGQMSPATLYANIVVTIETVFGLAMFAIATGLVFARFSRPTARVVFSRVAVVMPRNGVPSLVLRLANERRNQILEAQVSVTLLRDERTAEGELMRRFYDLRLERAHTPVFAMTFTVIHTIDGGSPLSGASAASLVESDAEIVVAVSGIDETMSQTVHARTSYLPDEVLWNRRFADLLGWTAGGRRAIDYRRFHDTEPL